MTFGVGGDADRLAEITSRRQFEEVRHRVVRNLGHVLRGCLHLRERRQGVQHEGGRERDGKSAPHVKPPMRSLRKSCRAVGLYTEGAAGSITRMREGGP